MFDNAFSQRLTWNRPSMSRVIDGTTRRDFAKNFRNHHPCNKISPSKILRFQKTAVLSFFQTGISTHHHPGSTPASMKARAFVTPLSVEGGTLCWKGRVSKSPGVKLETKTKGNFLKNREILLFWECVVCVGWGVGIGVVLQKSGESPDHTWRVRKRKPSKMSHTEEKIPLEAY